MPTDNFLNEIFSANSGEAILSLIRVDIDGDVSYYVNNNESVTSDVTGSPTVFQPAAFSIALPEESSDSTPRATLDFDAADIQIVRKLRAANQRIVMDLWVVAGSNPNVVEYGPSNYESTDFTISGTKVSIGLEIEPILDIEIPGKRYTPQTFPGLWRK